MDLLSLYKLFKLQGFETPEESFLLGFLMAHGGELHLLGLIEHDLELLEHNMEFWLPIVKEDPELYTKVCKAEIETARNLLIELMTKRQAKIPEWLKKETI